MKPEEAQPMILCTFHLGDETLGVEGGVVLEGLRSCEVRAVPLAPPVIAGMLAYRGEMLVAVSLRAVLGLPPAQSVPGALVLQAEESGEVFALLVDSLADVVPVEAEDWEPNPPTLDPRRAAMFRGAYKQDNALLAALDAACLQPSCVMKNS